MTKEKRRGQPAQDNTLRRRDTQPLAVDACTCCVQRATVGEDHNKDCLLYRRRGSGVCVLPNDSIHQERGRR